ncbi:acyltransferase family protein [Horticoccus sp. 23ND18S-11]|uniref:acyltransferase family protein n=1 Tax=Horticoccus sp. 23ND18S-11 TaxID=3391832 RepID=UPI0039C8D4ED
MSSTTLTASSTAPVAQPDRGGDTAGGAPRNGGRLRSLDAFRGFIMFTLAAGGFGAVQMARTFPDSGWAVAARQFSHTPWQWGVFWDLIMPSFLLMVGVAMPFSYAKRAGAGDPYGRQLGHAVIRAVTLALIGMVMMNQTARFLNVLTQIGLGYVFVFLLLGRTLRTQLAWGAGVLVAWWTLFALYPLPGPGYDFAAAGAKSADVLPGFFGHWSRNMNLAADFDRWLLNMLPADKPFIAHVGSTTTLNFIPASVNMLLGVIAGQMLLGPRRPVEKLRWLLVAGAVCLALGTLAGFTVCPVVKRIWTPAFALWSGGLTLWMLAVFYAVVDVAGWARWARPLEVLGANSIAVYLMTLTWPAWIVKTWKSLFGATALDGTYAPVWEHLVVLGVIWAVAWWLWRRRLFLRV